MSISENLFKYYHFEPIEINEMPKEIEKLQKEAKILINIPEKQETKEKTKEFAVLQEILKSQSLKETESIRIVSDLLKAKEKRIEFAKLARLEVMARFKNKLKNQSEVKSDKTKLVT